MRLGTKLGVSGLALAGVAVIGAAILRAGEAVGGGPNAIALGSVVADFTLKTPAGEPVAFGDFRKGKDGKPVPVVVAFWSFKCPSGSGAMDRFAALARAAAEKGGKLLAVCSYGESADAIGKYAKEHGIDYTLAVDEGCKVADIFGAKIVTATYVVDAAGKIAYRGGIGTDEPEAALGEVLAGKPVSKAETRAFG